MGSLKPTFIDVGDPEVALPEKAFCLFDPHFVDELLEGETILTQYKCEDFLRRYAEGFVEHTRRYIRVYIMGSHGTGSTIIVGMKSPAV